MKYTFLILLFFIKINVFAQKITSQVIDVSGGTHRANGYSMTYSLGQTATETLRKSNYIITQGFQQPENAKTTKSEEVSQTIDFQANVFPNPTQDVLHLTIEGNNEQDFQLQLFNMSGQQISIHNFSGNNYEIEVDQLVVGTYLLKLRNKKGDFSLSSKFVKM